MNVWRESTINPGVYWSMDDADSNRLVLQLFRNPSTGEFKMIMPLRIRPDNSWIPLYEARTLEEAKAAAVAIWRMT